MAVQVVQSALVPAQFANDFDQYALSATTVAVRRTALDSLQTFKVDLVSGGYRGKHEKAGFGQKRGLGDSDHSASTDRALPFRRSW